MCFDFASLRILSDTGNPQVPQKFLIPATRTLSEFRTTACMGSHPFALAKTRGAQVNKHHTAMEDNGVNPLFYRLTETYLMSRTDLYSPYLTTDYEHFSWFTAVSRARQLLAVVESPKT